MVSMWTPMRRVGSSRHVRSPEICGTIFQPLRWPMRGTTDDTWILVAGLAAVAIGNVLCLTVNPYLIIPAYVLAVALIGSAWVRTL